MICLYGGGAQQRDFSYVDDVVEAFLMAAASDKANGEVYNIGSGVPTSLREAAHLCVEIAGTGSIREVEFPDDKKKIEIGNYYADYSKIGREIGWAPRTPLREGIERTISFFRRHRRHYWESE